MATRNDLYPSAWCKATDVLTPVVVTIERCTVETVGQGNKAEPKPVLHFRGGTVKPLILNRTNYDAIVAITGDEETDEFAGTAIELYAVDVVGPNGPTTGVRVRRPRQQKRGPQRQTALPPEPPPPTDDDITAALGPNEGV